MKRDWKKLKVWPKSSVIGFFIGFLPWHLIILFLPWDVYPADKLIKIWICIHLTTSIFFTLVWFLLGRLLIHLKSKKVNINILTIILLLIYLIIIYKFISFEYFVWGLNEF